MTIDGDRAAVGAYELVVIESNDIILDRNAVTSQFERATVSWQIYHCRVGRQVAIDNRIIHRPRYHHVALGISVQPDVIARDKRVSTSQRETVETGFHVQGVCGGGIIKRALQHDGFLAVKYKVSGQSCGRTGRVKVKVGIQCHVTLWLAVIDKVLDIDDAVTVGIGAIPVDVHAGVECAAGLVKHGNDAGPLLKTQVIDIELDIFGIGARQTRRQQFDTAAIALQHQVGIKHARAVIHIHIVILIKRPMAIADDRIVAEKPCPHLVVCQTGVAAQAVAGLVLDVLLMQHEINRRALDTALNIHKGKIVPCTRPVAHVGIESEVFVVQLVGMDGDGVDVSRAIADTVSATIDVNARIAAHLAADVAEVDFALLQITLNQTVSAHVHIKIKPRHRVLETFHIHRALLELALELSSGALHVFDQGHHAARCIQVGISVLVLNGDAGQPRRAVQRSMSLVGNKQAAVELPVDVIECEIGVPLLSAQVDVALGMEFGRSVALAVIHAQAVQIQVAHIAVGGEDIVVVADGAVGISIKVTALIGTGGIYIGIAATQFAAGLDIAVMRAIVTHAGQIDGSVGPSGAAVGEVEAVTARIDTAREVLDVIIGQERLDGEIVERRIHIIILVADVIVAIAAQGTAARRNAQVASHPFASLLIEFSAHLHGRQFHVLQAQHLVEGAGIPQINLGIQVGLHAVHVGGIVNRTLTLDAAKARHIGIQRVDV